MAPAREIQDDAVPAIAVLLGNDIDGLLEAALDETRLAFDSKTISQVRYLPGRSITAQYRVETVSADGATAHQTLVATSGINVPEGVSVFGDGAVDIAVWQFPHDPFLPGLATATTPETATALLRQVGEATDSVEIRTRAYRAGRRAVIEVTAPGAKMFVKVVRPEKVAGLQAVHGALVEHLPVPRSLGWSQADGLVALQAMDGATLRRSLESRSDQLPSPASLIALLDRFPTPAADATKTSGPRRRVATHAQLLSAVAPELKNRIDELVGRLETTTSAGREPVHGDFHASQILVHRGEIIGLVDVDTTGVGDRIDDLATMLGQIATLGLMSPAAKHIKKYGTALMAEFDRHVDPVDLRLRAAAAVFGLATGPFRVQLPDWPAQTSIRLDLALAWAESANAIGNPSGT